MPLSSAQEKQKRLRHRRWEALANAVKQRQKNTVMTATTAISIALSNRSVA